MSLAKVGPSVTTIQRLIQVDSTKDNLMDEGSVVSVGQPVLLVGEVGVGKTSRVMKCGAITFISIL